MIDTPFKIEKVLTFLSLPTLLNHILQRVAQCIAPLTLRTQELNDTKKSSSRSN